MKAPVPKFGAKAFLWCPIFSSIAFMIQGAELNAETADCGGITDLPGMSELMTLYVVLSRVQEADGLLLLLRAFPRHCFGLESLQDLRASSGACVLAGKPMGSPCQRTLCPTRVRSTETAWRVCQRIASFGRATVRNGNAVFVSCPFPQKALVPPLTTWTNSATGA